jgi:hypothetical protein
MPAWLVGLLAAVANAMPALAALAHGYLFWTMIADAAAAAGLIGYVSYLAAVLIKKNLQILRFDART